MISQKSSARLFGIFLILSFLSYGIGIGLMEVVQNFNSMPTDLTENKSQIVVGGILVVFFHTLFNTGLLVVMFNVLKPFNQVLSYSYFVFGIFGTFMLAIGGIFLMLPISIGGNIIASNTSNALLFQYILQLCSNGNFYSYQLGMTVWGLGGLMLCYLLYNSKLIPRVLSICGYVGYAIFIIGTILELFGFPFGVMFSIPAGLFELALSFWLIFKGFSNTTT